VVDDSVTGDRTKAGQHTDDPGGDAGLLDESGQCRIDNGASSGGLTTTVLPAARAGAIFHPAIIRGVFHGMIAPMTPTGSRTV
jgi:hypothetical protein